jgi:hypothetical protein
MFCQLFGKTCCTAFPDLNKVDDEKLEAPQALVTASVQQMLGNFRLKSKGGYLSVFVHS